MLMWIFLIIFLIIIGTCLIFGIPRSKSKRTYELEGIYDPIVAETFEKMNRLFPFKIIRFRVISRIKDPQGKLVDLGCGSGRLLIQIAKKFKNVELMGIDVANEMVEIAKNEVNKVSLDKLIKFEVGSAENLPLSDNSIDYIVSTLSLHHWRDPLKAFNEINRVLKKGGTLLIFDFRRDSRKLCHCFIKFITKLIVPKPLKRIREPLGSLLASYSLKELEEMIASSAFKRADYKNMLCWIFIQFKK